jgi:hypothetical protein
LLEVGPESRKLQPLATDSFGDARLSPRPVRPAILERERRRRDLVGGITAADSARTIDLDVSPGRWGRCGHARFCRRRMYVVIATLVGVLAPVVPARRASRIDVLTALTVE